MAPRGTPRASRFGLGLLRNCSRTHADCALKAAGARRSKARLALSFPCLALSRARPAALSLTLVVTGLLTATEKRVTPIVVTRARLPDGTPRSPAAARCSPHRGRVPGATLRLAGPLAAQDWRRVARSTDNDRVCTDAHAISASAGRPGCARTPSAGAPAGGRLHADRDPHRRLRARRGDRGSL